MDVGHHAEDFGDPAARWVALDMESVVDTDSTATQMLVERLGDLAGRGVTVAFARLKAPVAAYLERAGVPVPAGSAQVYLEVDDAVAAFRALPSSAPSAPDPTGDRP